MQDFFDTRTVKFYDGEKAYSIDLSIANLENGEKVAYAKRFYGYDAELTKKYRQLKVGVKKRPHSIRSLYLITIYHRFLKMSTTNFLFPMKANRLPHSAHRLETLHLRIRKRILHLLQIMQQPQVKQLGIMMHLSLKIFLL